MSLLEQASLVVTPNGYKEGILYSVIPNTTLGDMDVVRATTATRVNSAGLIEGVAINIPRIDYTNGSCPSLLVEPQRTNLITYSEDLTNVSWNKYGGQIITANNAISPDGNLTADKMTSTGGVYKNETFSGNTDYSISVFIKKDTATSFVIEFADQASPFRGGGITYTFSNNNIAVSQSENGSVSGSYVNYPNNYVRLTLKFKTSNIATFNYQQFEFRGGTGWAWGFSMEAGTYPTSYIPTVATSVTRNADVISKTGISSLIGQTEGTMFVDVNIDLSYAQADMRFINVSDGSSTNWYFIGTNTTNEIRFYFRAGATTYVSELVTLTSGRHKLAFAYKNNDYVAYVDGTQVHSLISLIVGATSQVDLGNNFAGSNVSKQFINSAQLYKTRLTNTELAQLTTL